jgi:hypothetical protein
LYVFSLSLSLSRPQGFGLPHTDENFYNKDLGNCLDYTNTPQNNLHPSAMNYNYLDALYGSGNTSGYYNISKGSSNCTSGCRRRQQELQTETMPDWVREEWRQVSARALEASPAPSHWRLLRSSELGQVHEIDLGQGYRLTIEKLRPDWILN